MAKNRNTEPGGDFSKYIEVQRRLYNEKRVRRQLSYLILSLVYIVFLLAFFSFFPNKFGSLLAFPFSTSSSVQSLKKELEEQKHTLTVLQERVGEIHFSSTTPSSISVEIAEIRQKQEAIAETILLDAEKAITAPLLRQKQAELEDKMERIETQMDGLGTQFWYLLVGLILLPLFGLAWSLVGDKIKKLLGIKKESEF